jgi:lysozyme
MNINRREIFQAVRQLRDGRGFTLEEVHLLDAAIDRAFAPASPVEAQPAPEAPPLVSHLSLTPRVALELIGHEAIVPEAYKDSVGVWTWGIGVTNASGHSVDRYKDNPQPIERCLEVYLWLLLEKYIPSVVKAFQGFTLTEAQFAAALSFHYNTGAISRAGWVRKARAGDTARAKAAFMEWNKPREIIERRQKECDLFFEGKWSQDGKATVYDVRKPSYSPNWKTARRIDVKEPLARLLSKEPTA